MIILLWFDSVSSVLLFKTTSTIGIHFLWKLQNLITIEKTLQYSPIFFSLLRDLDSLNHKFFTNLSAISELPNEITKYWRDGPRSRVILYSLWNRVLRGFWCLWLTLWVNLLTFIACSHMKNNFHFGICDKQKSPQDSLALMVAAAHKYLSRTQSYRLHRYDLSNAWKEYNLQQLVGPIEEYFISYNCFLFCKWSFIIWKFTCETHGLHTQVFGFSSKVKMFKHLYSSQNICASTNPGNLLWKYFFFRDTLFIRDINKHHHNFTWKPWPCPCLFYQVQSFGCHIRCSIPTPPRFDLSGSVSGSHIK